MGIFFNAILKKYKGDGMAREVQQPLYAIRFPVGSIDTSLPTTATKAPGPTRLPFIL
jgi:hypothetical protein